MMKYVVFMALLVCAFAAPKTENAVTTQQPIRVSEFIAQAQKNMNDLAASIMNQLNNLDQKISSKIVTNQISNFAVQVRTYIDQMSTDIQGKKPEFDKLWTNTKDTLSQIVTEINTNVPKVKKSTEELKTELARGIQTFVYETNNIIDRYAENRNKIKEQVPEILVEVVDSAVHVFQYFNDQLKIAAAQATATKRKSS